MQFNFKNKGCVILPKLYCLNHQELKIKYNIDKSSAGGAMRGNDYHFGKYSNFKIWKERWGWEYENPKTYFNSIKEHYKNTLIGQFMEHDSNEGPLKTINLL
jgi:hypothetical protein